ncbi:hypothetical protein [Microcoleus sp. B13-B6]|uniref:hypothetical protein n=1 Tax=Microcoleus sp. B13-B6 TaxID=2818652 RepID=UPI002FD4A023
MIRMIDIPTTSYQLFNQLLIVENFSARISTPVNPFYKFVLVSVSQKGSIATIEDFTSSFSIAEIIHFDLN